VVRHRTAALNQRSPQSRRGERRLRSVRARELADRIREEILAGSFASGSLPDERSLTAAHGATRNTVRDALRLLVAEGLLVRRPGLGTRIATQKFAHSLDRLAGLAETLLEHGAISNEVRVARLEAASSAIAHRLEIDEGAAVLFLQRLRSLEQTPLSLDSSYITAEIGEALLQEDLRSRDVFALIEETAGGPLGTAQVTLHAENADPDIADALGVNAGDAVFVIDRLTRLADGRPVDLETIYLRGDRISFTSVLHRSPGPMPAGAPARPEETPERDRR
jgi:GntR family transcriptional regulator